MAYLVNIIGVRRIQNGTYWSYELPSQVPLHGTHWSYELPKTGGCMYMYLPKCFLSPEARLGIL